MMQQYTQCMIDCSTCRKDNPNRTRINGKIVSANECFMGHLLGAQGIRYEVHKDMQINCPFNLKRERQADLYLPDYDLYIEVKGMMTLSEVNKLRWLIDYSGKRVYVFVIGNEDWDGYCDERIKNSAKSKKESILIKQINELIAMRDRVIDVDELVLLSKLRLQEYVITRSADIIRWNKIVIERKM